MSATTETPDCARLRHARNRHIDAAIAHLHLAVEELQIADLGNLSGPGHRYAGEVLEILDGMAIDSEQASARRAAHARKSSPIGHPKSRVTKPAENRRV